MDNLIPYLQKEDFDILCFQEVSGGDLSFHKDNTFQRIIDLGYDGEICVNWRLKGNPHAFIGNATFFKPSFTLLEKKDIWLNDYKEIEDREKRDPRNDPRAPLSVILEKNGIKLHVVNAHLAWTPDAEDSEEKIRQGRMFYDYLETIRSPFIIAGDFNVEKHTEVVSMINKVGRNLTSENNIQNTLNPRLHKASHLFPPGLAVDYMYVSENIKVQSFEVLDTNLSDHLGLYLEARV